MAFVNDFTSGERGPYSVSRTQIGASICHAAPATMSPISDAVICRKSHIRYLFARRTIVVCVGRARFYSKAA